MTFTALLDIEGTVADKRFVHDVLFPYARKALPDLVARRSNEPASGFEDAGSEIDAALDETARIGGIERDDTDALVAQLLAWIDEDRKVTPLKTLQGIVWRTGYARGDFTAHLYPDAHAWMDRAHAAGVRLCIYSSGSVAAQQLYFAHTEYGDLGDWISGHFDTRTGPKTESESYTRIAETIDRKPGRIRFYSDVEAELDAAARAGMQTVHICRDGQSPSPDHAAAADFNDLPITDPETQ